MAGGQKGSGQGFRGSPVSVGEYISRALARGGHFSKRLSEMRAASNSHAVIDVKGRKKSSDPTVAVSGSKAREGQVFMKLLQ